jgi:hypothetical protein
MDASTTPAIPLGEYEHYKGGHYQVLGVGRHTETDEYYVIYAPLYESDGQPGFWLRPYEMFISVVGAGGEEVPRFRYIGPI